MSHEETQLMSEACRGLEDELRGAIRPWLDSCRAQRLLLHARDQDAAWARWVNQAAPRTTALAETPEIVQELAALVLTKTSTNI